MLPLEEPSLFEDASFQNIGDDDDHKNYENAPYIGISIISSIAEEKKESPQPDTPVALLHPLDRLAKLKAKLTQVTLDDLNGLISKLQLTDAKNVSLLQSLVE